MTLVLNRLEDRGHVRRDRRVEARRAVWSRDALGFRRKSHSPVDETPPASAGVVTLEGCRRLPVTRTRICRTPTSPTTTAGSPPLRRSPWTGSRRAPATSRRSTGGRGRSRR
ncbi:hypothetical protein [Microbacterium oxydans]|uniref:hypothetical protein n=1 Tax=Microbacterium oxydans TaxID=82380 RepID=UPI00226BACDC|nr:hypothetical protein [Microbacterium oxydans]WAA66665.1 hypothetical protein MME74_02655 [Microbacterium oxydans]